MRQKKSDAPLIEEWVSDNEDEVESPVMVEKKIVVPTIPKVDVVRPKQQEKPVRKTVRSGPISFNTARQSNFNVVRTNRVNAVKASAFGFRDLSNLIGNPETELKDSVRLNSHEDKKNTSVNVNSSVALNDFVNYVEMCNKCLELKAELIKQHNMVEKDEYNRLLKRFSKL
ncbi:hypothetical protein Tco_0911743 [Tanacetum coccineum]|uniref:Uncharacterized protein n=1 Tax=Tanacetum coccineum TaxID=301880 RepID=A0ABQ5CZT3_9ASTR